MCDGLKKTVVFDLMKNFPDLFLPLFTFTGSIDHRDVLNAIVIVGESELNADDCFAVNHLKRYINSCGEKGDGYMHVNKYN